ncbi:hypothetical protein Poli38472_001698 [Pythium oligandrum]|uniref:subtilisin n=1 Tax=Pythium oligandrum TaxID=41045 RepID=A0A8K1FS07_PYTOL|nr:hypothetical protein Poli38472_001698 [Pythium oligandrum]|eukprot:TMW69542.1 hypothetical protein Poli38472_001698 [Pythium oligandrum]
MRLHETLTLLLLCAAGTASGAPRVDPRVHRTLQAYGTVNLIVTMKQRTTSVVSTAHEAMIPDRTQRIERLVESLEALATSSQSSVSTLLSQESSSNTPLFTSSKSFWISNQVYIRDATSELLLKLFETSDVYSIHEEELYSPPMLATSGRESERSSNASVDIPSPTDKDWGVVKIGAPNVWATGNLGQDVVVAAIDTGVRGTHEALRNNFRGEYGWFDPEAHLAEPYDLQGHGTSVLSNLVGTTGTGVAPGATWMACKLCRKRACPQADLLACAEWVLCPTDPQGEHRDCSKAPRIINNSWGQQAADTSYESIIDAWRAAGIIPVFANGNSGPFCESVNYPAGYPNVLGVGATDNKDALKLISSVGPAVNGVVKPDFIAPGGDIRAASLDSDTSYAVVSATSIAAPHLSGSIALLLHERPDLSYDQVLRLLAETSVRTFAGPSFEQCGDPLTPDNVFPNNQFGYGRVDIHQAIEWLRSNTSGL